MIYVVPSLKANAGLITEAARWAGSIGAVFAARQGRSEIRLAKDYGSCFLVYTSRGPQIVRDEGTHFFSLNMAELRIQHIRQGKPDHLLEALGAAGPVRLLDCTCGFGADSIVASFGLPQGSVVHAMEVSPLLAAVTSWGFSDFVHAHHDVTAALRRIQLRTGDYMAYLRNETAPVYDVLYFDPMFDHPVASSCQFQPVRAIMDHHALTLKTIEYAMKKTRRRVVIKGRSFRELVQAFPEAKLYGGRYSRIGYAVLECESTNG